MRGPVLLVLAALVDRMHADSLDERVKAVDGVREAALDGLNCVEVLGGGRLSDVHVFAVERVSYGSEEENVFWRRQQSR